MRASVIVHLDRRLLPKDIEDEARRETEKAGEEWVGFREYSCLRFGFDDEDRVTVFMGGDVAVCVWEQHNVLTLDEATGLARDWVGDRPLELPFENTPGLYQAAFYEYLTGHEYDMGPLMFMWALPAEGDYVPVREFPGRVKE